MSDEITFEEMDSNDIFAHLMDDSSEKMKWNRSKAMELLGMANEYAERADKLRHLAAVLVLEAQAFADETANLLTMEFPMGDTDEDPDGEEEDE